jgi:hypothetical protein
MGEVLGSCRLAQGSYVIDVTRVKHGSRTVFVETVNRRHPKNGDVRVAYRGSDDFPSDKTASAFIRRWFEGITRNRGYKVLHQDDSFL